MSDKSRNMNDINDQKTAEQQAFSEEIRRRLAEPGSGKPTLDEFKVMVYKDREKRRKKRNALVACIVAAFIVGYLTYDDLVPEVGADKNPKETIQTEEGVIIEDGGWGSSEEKDDIWITEDWEQVEDAKEITPKLRIPRNLPNGFKFKVLIVETIVEEDVTCEFVFENNMGETVEIEEHITNNGLVSIEVQEYDRIITSDSGKIYIKTEEKQIATTQIDDGIIINIWSELTDEEILNIVNGLK